MNFCDIILQSQFQYQSDKPLVWLVLKSTIDNHEILGKINSIMPVAVALA